jgi:tRNA pseudouridine38-40 synthase
MRVRAIVSYDGTDYAGFQRQANAFTVQEALEAVLSELTQETVTVLAAGRTDAGVHALGQVIAFDTPWKHSIDELQKGMNALLPADVAVRDLQAVSSGFHPRFDAQRRHYRYRVYDGRIRSPLVRRYSLHLPYALDVAAMNEAAGMLPGEQDFATFGQPPNGEITVRRVFRAVWQREPCCGTPFEPQREPARFLCFDIEANAFLYRMVRSLVGTMLDVGQGRMSVDAFKDAFASCDRSRAGKTVAPEGLCLVGVAY